MKEYEFRDLTASDIFPVCNIMSKIGLTEIKNTLDPDIVQKVISGSSGNEQTILGFNIVVDLVDILLKNLPKCQDELYSFLASLTNKPIEDIASMKMNTFIEMIIDVFQKEEFKDFFKAVSKLLK